MPMGGGSTIRIWKSIICIWGWSGKIYATYHIDDADNRCEFCLVKTSQVKEGFASA